ncbi:MAG: hypothetical protein ABEN55_03800 [Bradymonadaceae bacterium]
MDPEKLTDIANHISTNRYTYRNCGGGVYEFRRLKGGRLEDVVAQGEPVGVYRSDEFGQLSDRDFEVAAEMYQRPSSVPIGDWFYLTREVLDESELSNPLITNGGVWIASFGQAQTLVALELARYSGNPVYTTRTAEVIMQRQGSQ